jgi:predicted RNase H-like HicB family nuclease
MHIVLEKQDEGGYTAYIPELPGCVSQGETKQEALKNIGEAKELYLETVSAKKLHRLVSRVSVLPAVA